MKKKVKKADKIRATDSGRLIARESGLSHGSDVPINRKIFGAVYRSQKDAP